MLSYETNHLTPNGAGNATSEGTSWAAWNSLGTMADGLKERNDGKAPYVSMGAATSKVLYANDFNLDIPTGATINGVEVIYRVKRGTTVITSRVTLAQLYWSNGVQGNNKYSSTPQTITGDYANHTLGGSTDLWGATITPTIVNDSGFGVALRVQNTSSTTGLIFIDHLTLKIYYSLSDGTSQTLAAAFKAKPFIPEMTGVTIYNTIEPIKVVVLNREEEIVNFLDITDVSVKQVDNLEGESTLEVVKTLTSSNIRALDEYDE